MKVAYFSDHFVKVVSPQAMGKLIAKIDRDGAWSRSAVTMQREQDGPLITVRWVTGNPQWVVYSQTFKRVTPEEERFIKFGRRSGRMVAQILGLHKSDYPVSALLVREPGDTQWTWDDTMGDGATFRQIARYTRDVLGQQSMIVKGSTLFKLWKQGRIV